MRVVLAVLVLCAASCPSALGVGKITEDPNIPGARIEQEPEESLRIDHRLAQKVTIRMSARSTAEVLAELSRQTGVKLLAGFNDSDWQVRDRRMNIFASETPLAHLMNSIARVMKFRWSVRGEPGAYTYRLVMDRKSLLSAEAQQAREEERLEQQRAGRRLEALESYYRSSNLSPEDMVRLREENPFLYAVARSGLSRSLGSFFSATPPAADAIARNYELTLSASQLPPAAQQGLLDAVRDLSNLIGGIVGGAAPGIPDFTGRLDETIIRINPDRDARAPGRESALLLGAVRLELPADGSSPSRLDLPLLDPDTRSARLLGEWLLEADETGRSFEEIIRERGRTAFLGALLTDLKKDEQGEPRVENPDDPELERKIEIKLDSNRLEVVQEALADASGFAIVSDSLGPSRGFLAPLVGDTTIRKVLDSIAEGFHYNWERRASVLEFYDREWFRKRALQVPDAWLNAWRGALKNTGTLDIPDLAQIAALTPEQIDFNFLPGDILTRAGVPNLVRTQRDLLAIYSALTPPQQAAVFSEAGLDLAQLRPDQRTAAFSLLSRRRPGIFDLEDRATVVLRGTRNRATAENVQGQTPDSRRAFYSYNFTAACPEWPEPIRWSFNTPVYVPDRPEQSGR